MKWEPILDCDDEAGNHTTWSSKIDNKKYGKFIWISKTTDDDFEVTTSDRILAKCKSLASAKRWVTMNIRQVEE